MICPEEHLAADGTTVTGSSGQREVSVALPPSPIEAVEKPVGREGRAGFIAVAAQREVKKRTLDALASTTRN
ncbi:hypothetical protein [Streptomyces sp. NPDC019224]|uniref:hypothetical protein n=1 Tax=Streptomyces sp. NPDC019224 TaxID=3154484 RepID=UPI0034048B51